MPAQECTTRKKNGDKGTAVQYIYGYKIKERGLRRTVPVPTPCFKQRPANKQIRHSEMVHKSLSPCFKPSFRCQLFKN